MQLSSLSLALTAAYGPGFAWRNLFTNNTPGFRVNVEEAIRLNQQALGPELVVGAWTPTGSGDMTFSVSDGVVTMNRPVAGINGYPATPLGVLAAGKTYLLQATVATATTQIRIGTSPGNGTVVANTTSVGTTTLVFSGSGVAAFASMWPHNAGTSSAATLSVREIDLSKCVAFQDSAGTLPVVSMEQPLGLILDTKLGVPVAGPELVTNGDFSNGTTGWSVTGGSGGSHAVVSGELEVTSTGAGVLVSSPITTVVGKTYALSVAARNGTYSGATIGPATTTNATPSPLVTINSTTQAAYRLVFTATQTTTYISIRFPTTTAGTAYFDNISVRELPGNHFVQPSNTASRPIVSRRVNLLTATATLTTQDVTTLAASHVLTLSGTGSVTLSGAATGTYSAGTHTITTTAGTLTVTVSGSVTNADLRLSSDVPGLPSYQRVTSSTDYDEVGFPAYARFDGLDDWLETGGTVGMTSTDEVTVVAGVTKLSGDQAIILESSSSVGTAGTFALFSSPISSSVLRSWNFVSNGTAVAIANPPGNDIPAPAKRLLTGIAKISTDTAVLRVNGATYASSTANQGSGNYSAQKFYMGRRGGTSLPFNGRIYGITVIGKLLTDSQLAAAEQAERQMGRLY